MLFRIKKMSKREKEAQETDRPVVEIARAIDLLEAVAVHSERSLENLESLRALPAVPYETFLAALAADPRGVRTRLDRVVMSDDPEIGFDALLEVGALRAIFPEVHAMVGFGDGEWRHKDVWKHTKQVVRQATPQLEVRWAALFHDIGKVKTRSIAPDGTVHFLGHAEVGTRMFDRINRRVGLFSSDIDDALRATIRFLVLHHLRANQYDRGWTDSAVRRFARELGEHLPELFCLSRADITTKRPEKKRRGIEQLDDLQARIAKLAEEDARVPPLPSGVGNEIMSAFGLKPSRLVGTIKQQLEEAIAKGEIEGHQPIEVYVDFVRGNRERFGIS